MTQIRQNLTAPISSNARVPWVDVAKGICIVLVVMMHTTLGLEKALETTGWMHALVEFARPFRMPDFFLISGLFLAATIDRPWRLYLDRKVIHFLYFYILWVLIQFAFKSPFLLADGHSIGTIAKTLALSIIQPFGTLWFIYMLPVFFVITKLFRSYPWHLFAAAILLQILPVNTSHLWSALVSQFGIISVDSHWVLIDEFSSFFVYFLAGYLFAPKLFEIANSARQHNISAILVLVGWFVTNLLMVVYGVASWPIVSLLLGGAGAVAIVTLASLISGARIGLILKYLGSRSIVVYLAFFIPMVIARLAMMQLTPDLDVGTMAALGTVFAVTTPLVGLALINRINFGHFLFKRPAWAMLSASPNQRQTAVQPAE